MANRYWSDVSNNQPGTIGWHQYRKAGHVLVGLKASEGETFIDKTFAPRAENAHAAGIHVISYHFGHPAKSASQQAQHYWNQIRGHFGRRDFACLDIEVADGRSDVHVAKWSNEFMASLKRISGHSTILYSGESYLKGLLRAGLKVPTGRCWIAAYGPHKPSCPGVSTWSWQFTDGAIGPQPHACAGIGKSDTSILNWATYLRLRALKP